MKDNGMESMIDRVEKALRDNIEAALPTGTKIDYRYAALAAIEAMREPTAAMMEMGQQRLDRGGAYLNWIQMIDAALVEQEKV